MIHKHIQFLFREYGYNSRTIGRTPTILCCKSIKTCPVYKSLVDIELLPVVKDPDNDYTNQLQYFNAIVVNFPESFSFSLSRQLSDRYCTICKQCSKGQPVR